MYMDRLMNLKVNGKILKVDKMNGFRMLYCVT
jgi:hypothetical protein